MVLVHELFGTMENSLPVLEQSAARMKAYLLASLYLYLSDGGQCGLYGISLE